MQEKITGLTAKEVSKILGCSEYTVRQKAREKSLPHYRVGKRVFFTRESIENWIREQELSSIQQAENF